jgi:KUP system potassium uptake protein
MRQNANRRGTIGTACGRRADADRIRLVPVGAGITRVIFYFGFMETPDIMEGLRLACRRPELQGIDPENITYYFRRVMVIASEKASGMRSGENLVRRDAPQRQPAGGVFRGPAQVVEVGLEVEI